MMEDEQLLGEYAEKGSEQAFSELVSRHIDLVYSTSVRLLGGDTHLAQDVVQTVFTDLSRKAKSRRGIAVLAGWLYRHTFFVASSTVRAERRRRNRERQAAQMNASDGPPGPDWQQLCPVLDEALQGLGTTDRNAILLRYFQGRDLKSVGIALGTNEDAAQKRVSRAIGKLRSGLSKRGVTLTATSLAAAIASQAVSAAPAGMAASITAATLAGTGTASGTALTWIKLMAWLKTKTAIVSASVVLLTGVTISYLIRTEFTEHPDSGIQGRNAAASPQPNNIVATAADKNGGFGFNWSQVESADYRRYVANLRAVGCPESTVRDIIAADLNQLYRTRAEEIWKPARQVYWKKSQNASSSPSPEQIKKFMALDKEKAAIAKELLGVAIDPLEFVNLAWLRVDDAESPLLFLPAEKREQALQALREGGYQEKLDKMREAEPNMDDREMFDEKLRLLAKVLSPSELEEYRLRNAPRAAWLRDELDYLDCTTDEFKALLDLRDRKLASAKDNLAVDRATAIADARAVLGEDRAREYERVSDLGYLNARRAAERAGLPADLADRAGQIGYEARVEAEKIALDSTLPAEERQRQIKSLQTQAETRVKTALGDQPIAGVLHALRFTLDNTAGMVRP